VHPIGFYRTGKYVSILKNKGEGIAGIYFRIVICLQHIFTCFTLWSIYCSFSM